MPRKDTTTTPPNPPSERPAPKAMTIDLTLDAAAKLRKVSAKTGFTQAYLRSELSRSREVESAIIKALHQIYRDWKEDLADDLFGPPPEKSPDANGGAS